MKSQAIQLITHLNPLERDQLKLWLDNDLHNSSLKIRKLGHYLLDHLHEFTTKSISKEMVFKEVIGDKAFNEYRINNLLSDLQQVVLQFLTYLRIKDQTTNNLIIQGEDLMDRKALEFVPKILRKLNRLESENKKRSFHTLQNQEQKLQLEDLLHLSKKPHDYSPALQDQMNTLDEYYLVKKLRLACEMQNRSRLIKEKYDIGYWTDFLPIVELIKQKNPCIAIYYLCLQMLTNREDQEFELLFSKLITMSDFFPKEELRVLYGYLLNFGIDKINSGKTIYYQKIFSIYQTMISSGLIFSNEYISEWTFKNIVTTGIRIKKYDWTKDFISTYKTNLPKKDYENAVAYNLASLYFAEKDFSASLQALLGVEFTDATYFIGAKLIQLKSYYELGETEAFFSLIDSFRKYISRNKKLSVNKIESNENFLRLAKRLYKLKTSKNIIKKKSFDQKAKDFGKKLSSITPLANKDWIQSTYEELI